MEDGEKTAQIEQTEKSDYWNKRELALPQSGSYTIPFSALETLRSNVVVARTIASVISTSLGPTSHDKLIIRDSGEVFVTNDGFKILKEMKIEHPVVHKKLLTSKGKMLVSLSEGQDSKSGDGTTSVVVLATSMLEKALKLVEEGIHPHAIIQAFQSVSMLKFS
jgi:chaperonin GroEL (HSP60 family)